MCGVFVAFNYDKQNFGKEAFIEATNKVSHRGPDNIGHFYDNHCFLGHTRLSIVGIDESGNQPFMFENLVMTFNGEIFNFIELREELKEVGYKFDTHSDTEVVIKSFHYWGGGCFTKFNGMWGLVIYNRESGEITISRDRFGQKPLFVLSEGNTTYIASEVQQLANFSDKEIDYGLIQLFLKEGGFDGAGRTFFRSIELFPKAHYCQLNRQGKRVSVRYWNYWDGPVEKVSDDCFEKFSTLLQDAIRIRLRTDVPYGILLSGGVDSTIIAAYAREFSNIGQAIPAYTYSSNDKDDESKYAEKVAIKLGLDLTIREQEKEPKEYRERLKQLVTHMGRGHSSPAIVSVDYLYESVEKTGIKVALDGQGADELLAGYKNYFLVLIPIYLIKGQFRQAAYCLKDQFRFGFLLAMILYLRNKLPDRARRVMRWLYGYERFFKTYTYTPKKPSIEIDECKIRNGNALNRYLISQHNLGLENLLFYGDIVSMKNSVENRSPFMDHRLVDFVFSRSEELKVWNAVDKNALRSLPVYQTFREELERKKIGFSSGIDEEIKRFMVDELRKSPILEWPIFSGSLTNFFAGDGFLAEKYERLVFRIYQVHLWNEAYFG